MKSKKQIPFQPFRQLVVSKLELMASKDPPNSFPLDKLKTIALNLFSAESGDYKSIKQILNLMVQQGEELNEGYSASAMMNLEIALNGLARELLCEGIDEYPQLDVSFTIASARLETTSGSDSRHPGNRTQLGGKPTWIQGNQTPICEQCQRGMTFVAQIDSLSAEESEMGKILAEKKSFMFGDVGMIYLFWCEKCFETKSLIQCH